MNHATFHCGDRVILHKSGHALDGVIATIDGIEEAGRVVLGVDFGTFRKSCVCCEDDLSPCPSDDPRVTRLFRHDSDGRLIECTTRAINGNRLTRRQYHSQSNIAGRIGGTITEKKQGRILRKLIKEDQDA